MKNFLAVFMGKEEARDAWNKLSESERNERGQKGMAAWHGWVQEHSKNIVYMGSPLGKTKLVNKNGISDFKNELAAFTVVQAENHEAAAKMFVNHPHFAIFPGDRVEVLECLPIPGAK